VKTIGNSLLANLHYIIGLYAIYSIYLVWDQYEIRNTSLDSQIPEIQEEIAVFNKKLDAIDEYKANIENSKKRIEEVFKSIEFVQKQLPAEINDIEILDFLSKEAKSLNIPTIEPTPQLEVPNGFYIAKPYKLKGSGTYLQFLIFLERLSKADRLFNIQSISLKNDNQNQKGRFHVIEFEGLIDTFKYNSNHKESSGLESLNLPDESTLKVKKKKKKPNLSGE
jgi:Tfp pilus assembly protein PilO